MNIMPKLKDKTCEEKVLTQRRFVLIRVQRRCTRLPDSRTLKSVQIVNLCNKNIFNRAEVFVGWIYIQKAISKYSLPLFKP